MIKENSQLARIRNDNRLLKKAGDLIQEGLDSFKKEKNDILSSTYLSKTVKDRKFKQDKLIENYSIISYAQADHCIENYTEVMNSLSEDEIDVEYERVYGE